MPVEVKICGITDEDAMDAAIEAEADYVGLVFYPPSPRAVTPERAATARREAGRKPTVHRHRGDFGG